MIKDKLNELGEFVETINETKPITLLETNIKKIEENLKEFPIEQFNLGHSFSKDILEIVEEHKIKETSNSIIICELYNIIINILRKTTIEEKAELLGIDKKLYKNEMKLLFKGK